MRCALLAIVAFGSAVPGLAQRVDDNATKSADDAFGTTVGNESVGLYSPDNVRGFSPVDAGNVRIDGLYFDQQAFVTNRLLEGRTVRVGLSAQGYPFPAPTGIGDYAIRRAGDDNILSVGAGYGPYGGWQVEADAKVSIVEGVLGIAGGVGIYREHGVFGGTPRNESFAVLPRWRPAEGVEILPFWSHIKFADDEAQPVIFSSGAFLPQKIKRRRFYGQPWADNSGGIGNYGVLARADLGGWILRGGVFRSAMVSDTGFSDLFLDTDRNGVSANHLIIADAPQKFASTSGEIRLQRALTEGPRRHTLTLAARGREQKRRFGGSDVIPLGADRIGVPDFVTKPTFTFGAQTRDTVRQKTGGVSYQGQWKDIGELSFGVQKTDYEKRTRTPTGALPTSTGRPVLFNGTAALYATKSLAIYAGYTRGLEESAAAPNNATNKDEAPPAIGTRQIDAGVRWAIDPDLKLVIGAFQVEKPYYNLNAANLFTKLGEVRHRGLELSLAGEVVKGLNVVAGTILLDAKVSGVEVDAGLIRNRPVGAISRFSILSLDYSIAAVKGLSVDAFVESTGDRYASATTALVVPPRAVLALGARYRFKAGDTPMTVRAQAVNVFNNYGWAVGGSGAFVYNRPRGFSLNLAADI